MNDLPALEQWDNLPEDVKLKIYDIYLREKKPHITGEDIQVLINAIDKTITQLVQTGKLLCTIRDLVGDGQPVGKGLYTRPAFSLN